MGPLDGKVAFITGAGRGQGRSHAVTLAAAGADIVATDIGLGRVDTVPYPLASQEDLDETGRLVEKTGRRCLTIAADVRDIEALDGAVAAGIREFGGIDIALANAGVLHLGAAEPDLTTTAAAWRDAVDVMMTGAFNTVKVVAGPMVERGRGGSIVITSSVAGLKGMSDGSGGLTGYNAAKHGVVGIMRGFAQVLGPHQIRVNTVHPMAVNTEMIHNEVSRRFLSIPEAGEVVGNKRVLPVTSIDPVEVSNAILWLVSDAARYVTGVTLPVDAGITVA
ncbi:mycofactocin-coupled SDR family oxidoreductase [Pseudonocardia pini]|uniref:mycofactocin-coupled SDR family oxidoreductase n=1 Tax=Pseudonocardia pini TaxID=2758030 RepID=UPI0015F07CB4|nr:mycofactocin-coupled SDR family oxidoreductase [Pseudonocardia pini]